MEGPKTKTKDIEGKMKRVRESLVIRWSHEGTWKNLEERGRNEKTKNLCQARALSLCVFVAELPERAETETGAVIGAELQLTLTLDCMTSIDAGKEEGKWKVYRSSGSLRIVGSTVLSLLNKGRGGGN